MSDWQRCERKWYQRYLAWAGKWKKQIAISSEDVLHYLDANCRRFALYCGYEAACGSPDNGMSSHARTLRTFILAGGLGTRLRAVSGNRPKGMMPVGGQPFLARLVERLAEQQLSDIVLCLGYGAAEIRSYFEAHTLSAVRVHYSVETEPRG